MSAETIQIKSLPSEAEVILREYARLQEREKGIRDKKLALRQRLDAHLPHTSDHEIIWSNLDGKRVKISRAVKTKVNYDEKLLKQRLGGAYKEILVPDLSRIRRKMHEISGIFKPVLDVVGSPDRFRVKQAIDRGIVSPVDFDGAYEKKEDVKIAVTVCQQKAAG